MSNRNSINIITFINFIQFLRRMKILYYPNIENRPILYNPKTRTAMSYTSEGRLYIFYIDEGYDLSTKEHIQSRISPILFDRMVHAIKETSLSPELMKDTTDKHFLLFEKKIE